MNRSQILDHQAIAQKTRRMAHQIVEENYDVKELLVIGIIPGGLEYAAFLIAEIKLISKVKIELFSLQLNKKNPLATSIDLARKNSSLDEKTVLLVDDVANTGKTLYYALKPVMDFSPRKVQIAALVDRQHKLFPVSCDFVGLSLSTTLQEHISVVHEKHDEWKAFLD